MISGLTCFTHFSKKYSTSAITIFREASTIIIFKLCKFSVNLWTLCFVSYKMYQNPFESEGTKVGCNLMWSLLCFWWLHKYQSNFREVLFNFLIWCWLIICSLKNSLDGSSILIGWEEIMWPLLNMAWILSQLNFTAQIKLAGRIIGSCTQVQNLHPLVKHTRF